MINEIKLKSGSSPEEPNLEMKLTPITVFVGPNNSGKSRILIEIEKFSRNTSGQPNDLILDKLTFTSLSEVEITNELNKITQQPKLNENLNEGQIIIGKVSSQNNRAKRVTIDKAQVIQTAQNPTNNHWY